VIGAGVLSLPNAMANLGWVGGPICFVVFALITLYAAQLQTDLYIIDGQRQRTYSDMVFTVFGRKGRIAIDIVQQSNLVLTALAYTYGCLVLYALR
jgi:amino acid permease